MFEVLVYLFENYYQAESYPDHSTLSRKLTAAGFENEDISEALDWLNGLNHLSDHPLPAAFDSRASHRTFVDSEQSKLSIESRGFLMFLESAGVLSPVLREMIIERAMALEDDVVGLEDSNTHKPGPEPVLVALANVFLMQGVQKLPEPQKVAAYLNVYEWALVIPAISVAGVVLQVDKSLEECARVCGASWGYQMRTVTLPLLKPGILAAWLLIFMACVRELGTSVFLMGPNAKVIAPSIVQWPLLWTRGAISLNTGPSALAKNSSVSTPSQPASTTPASSIPKASRATEDLPTTRPLIAGLIRIRSNVEPLRHSPGCNSYS